MSSKQERTRRNRQFVNDYLKDKCCKVCGETDNTVLQFDHVRGEKRKAVSDLVCQAYGIASIEEEIAKCDILCANCHQRKTAKDQDWYSNMNDDKVNHPSHYTKGGIECIEAIQSSMSDEGFKGYLKGNFMKYIWRYEHKNGKEDLEKANWYLRRLTEITYPQVEEESKPTDYHTSRRRLEESEKELRKAIQEEFGRGPTCFQKPEYFSDLDIHVYLDKHWAPVDPEEFERCVNDTLVEAYQLINSDPNNLSVRIKAIGLSGAQYLILNGLLNDFEGIPAVKLSEGRGVMHYMNGLQHNDKGVAVRINGKDNEYWYRGKRCADRAAWEKEKSND